jgi:hypothetical protein
VLGFVVGHRAMKEAMARAKLTGIGAVTIRNTILRPLFRIHAVISQHLAVSYVPASFLPLLQITKWYKINRQRMMKVILC